MPNPPRPPSVSTTTKKPATDEKESATLKYLKKGELPPVESTGESEEDEDKGKRLK